MHNHLHAFCKRKDAAFTLDILLDIKKLYPLISRHADETVVIVAMFRRRIFLRNKRWVSIT